MANAFASLDLRLVARAVASEFGVGRDRLGERSERGTWNVESLSKAGGRELVANHGVAVIERARPRPEGVLGSGQTGLREPEESSGYALPLTAVSPAREGGGGTIKGEVWRQTVSAAETQLR